MFQHSGVGAVLRRQRIDHGQGLIQLATQPVRMCHKKQSIDAAINGPVPIRFALEHRVPLGNCLAVAGKGLIPGVFLFMTACQLKQIEGAVVLDGVVLAPEAAGIVQMRLRFDMAPEVIQRGTGIVRGLTIHRIKPSALDIGCDRFGR